MAEYVVEILICIELGLDQVTESQFNCYVLGHYSRPDVFRLMVNEKE